MDTCANCIHRPTCGLVSFYEAKGEHITKCPRRNPVTNYFRLISKTPEELAVEIAEKVHCLDCPILEMCCKLSASSGRTVCVDMWLKWLKSPVEVDNG